MRTLRATNPALLTAPFSVGEVHQQIMPYRHFRRELGLETNQEYEITLMHLLSGAGNYLDVDERLRDGLARELGSGSPEPSRVRDYADAQVSINPAALAALQGQRDPQPARRHSTAVLSADQSGTTPEHGGCRYCGGALPAGRAVRFCPHCGQNLEVHNCPACGAELEEGWKFCVACGKTVLQTT